MQWQLRLEPSPVEKSPVEQLEMKNKEDFMDRFVLYDRCYLSPWLSIPKTWLKDEIFQVFRNILCLKFETSFLISFVNQRDLLCPTWGYAWRLSFFHPQMQLFMRSQTL
jgi:hypothetical protein